MALVICPRCELNYMEENEEMCSVCRKEMKGETEQFYTIEICSECGENPVVPGFELCANCLKELQQRNDDSNTDDMIVREDANIGIDSVTGMDEIDLGDDTGEDPFGDDDADIPGDDEEDDL